MLQGGWEEVTNLCTVENPIREMVLGLLCPKKWKEKVLEVKRVSDRLIAIKLKISENMVNIVSAYGPQVGYDEDEKEDFWTDLEDLIGEMSEKEELVIGET